jgi:hypothetical protein
MSKFDNLSVMQEKCNHVIEETQAYLKIKADYSNKSQKRIQKNT